MPWAHQKAVELVAAPESWNFQPTRRYRTCNRHRHVHLIENHVAHNVKTTMSEGYVVPRYAKYGNSLDDRERSVQAWGHEPHIWWQSKGSELSREGHGHVLPVRLSGSNVCKAAEAQEHTGPCRKLRLQQQPLHATTPTREEHLLRATRYQGQCLHTAHHFVMICDVNEMCQQSSLRLMICHISTYGYLLAVCPHRICLKGTLYHPLDNTARLESDMLALNSIPETPSNIAAMKMRS